MLGLAEIAIKNERVPVVSTVTMSEEIFQRCSQLCFEMAHIIRPIDQLRKVRDIYEADRNVVGIDIQQKNLGIQKIFNTGDENFEGVIKRFVK